LIHKTATREEWLASPLELLCGSCDEAIGHGPLRFRLGESIKRPDFLPHIDPALTETGDLPAKSIAGTYVNPMIYMDLKAAIEPA
jgi:hypothetical protein